MRLKSVYIKNYELLSLSHQNNFNNKKMQIYKKERTIIFSRKLQYQ